MEKLSWKEVFKKNLRELIFEDRCSSCLKKIDREGFICSKCLRKLLKEGNIKNIENFYFLYYYDEIIRNIIADYKLRGRKSLGIDLAFIVREPLNTLIKNEKIDIIIPVPINKERLKERGFNQIEYILDILQINYLKIERVKNTKHMYSLNNYNIRRKNVENAFKNILNLSNKKILLIDDIVTSGSTIKSIVKEIKKVSKNVEIKVFSLAMSKKFKSEEK